MALQPAPRSADVGSAQVTIGHDVLGLISSAMYTEPLTVYRELIQNAADSIDQAVATGVLRREEGRVELMIDALHRQIIVRDNGVGIANGAFVTTMCSIGSSPKRGTAARGFRGIGRLVGLGYAQELVFRSRSSAVERVYEAIWDCRHLKDLLRSTKRAPLADVIAQVLSVTHRQATPDDPTHFFDIELRKVVRLADDALLNAGTVENHLQEVAPVPFHSSFKMGEAIAARLEQHARLLTVRIFINGSSNAVTRPYLNKLTLSKSKSILLEEFDFFEFPSVDDELGAIAWVARHEYVGALPRSLGVRGLRARVGNLQIGDERCFASAFVEERFVDWCVGEVHVLDPRIIPNGRRDAFEPNVHFDNLLNHLSHVGKSISKSARISSIDRRTERGLASVEATLRDFRALVEVVHEAYLLRDELLSDVRAQVDRAKRNISGPNRRTWERQIAKVEKEMALIEKIRPRSRRATQREMGRIDVIRMLRSTGPSGLSASAHILKVLARGEVPFN